ncbi:hypothetical protein GUJ93_ZPchr0012g20430 [Zizania palustris]|uniref:Uncharacterized protein n=1 Tax=Zizania palustris TaxID=103762 RepID=A0A8J5WTT1_ZIZPA|nr:hypothetical protein GUJ93_ZPchr0012g20430 [Zizania palustris]
MWLLFRSFKKPGRHGVGSVRLPPPRFHHSHIALAFLLSLISPSPSPRLRFPFGSRIGVGSSPSASMTAADAEAYAAAAAADIIALFRAADLSGWTPPLGTRPRRRRADEEELAWPTVARGKRSRSRRRSPSGSASATKGRWPG